MGSGVPPAQRGDPHPPAARRQGPVLGSPRRPGGLDERALLHPARLGPGHRTSTPTPQPTRADGTTVNLFCAGHAYLPDGRLLVAGGHITDGDGIDHACTYDYRTNTWTPLPPMNGGRWYPTATTLADGRVLVISGSAAVGGTIAVNAVPQIWDGAAWAPTVTSSACRSTRACTSPRTVECSWRAPTR